MEKIQEAITKLVGYGVKTNLVPKEDIIYTVNSLIMTLGLDEYEGSKEDIISESEKIGDDEIES
jgi:UDPglucose--hexose-1-phosphate uridylyltransferase